MTASIAKYLPASPNFEGLHLGKKSIAAFELMAWEGLPLHEAAKRTGMRNDNLRRTFNLPKVQQRWSIVVRHIRKNEGQAAIARISDLSRNANSEHVRLEASKWLAGIEGTAPVTRVQGEFRHRLEFSGYEYPTLDVTPEKDG